MFRKNMDAWAKVVGLVTSVIRLVAEVLDKIQ